MHDVAALDHEAFENAVEFCAFVALGRAGLGVAGLAGAELAEVFGGEGVGAGEEVDENSA